ncbi:hypothetical protein FQN49_000973 [Arthroderma sp. PD_2]|nr:hypothetical protein FQN49_000973 [Arthroderma sp. PD_2]
MDVFRSAEFTAYVKNLIDQHHVPGLSIAIIDGDRTDSAGFGKASLNPSKECTADTIFDIASASKSLTAASVALLVDDNDKYPLVQYETPMTKLLPEEFVMSGNDHDEVSLEDILSHRSGMAPHDHSYLGPNAAKPDDARSITMNLRNLMIAAPNRSEYLYCNMMYTVAAYLVECKSGLTFSDFLQTHLLKPLAMNSTHLQPGCAQANGLGDRIATGYFWDDEDGKYVGTHCPDAPEAQGAGRIMSSAKDYIKWIEAMMKQKGPITKTIYEGIIKKRISETPPADSDESDSDESEAFPTFYASGWEILEYSGYMMVSHDGSEHGFGTTHFFLPELNFGAVVFGNSNGAGDVAGILKYKMTDWAVHIKESGSARQLLDSMTAFESSSGTESESDEHDHDASIEIENELLEELGGEGRETTAQTMPLSAYTGQYWNEGYRGLKVEVKDGGLFIDATDRSMGFTLTFKHAFDQTKYIAHITELPDRESSPIKAEFKLEGEQAVELGLNLESSLEEYIWFKRTED